MPSFMMLTLPLAFALAAASTMVDNEERHVAEVFSNDVSKPKHVKDRVTQEHGHHVQDHHKQLANSNARKQWFGSDVGASAGSSANAPLHKKSKRHQHDGFKLDEMVHHQKGHHPHSLEQEGQLHTVRAGAGIPILQASMTKPDVRDTWSMDIEDAPEDDGMAPPRDVFNNPGDALLEIGEASARKTGLLMRREAKKQRSLRRATSQCESCMNCSGAMPNLPDNDDHSDGSWCMCKTWEEWTATTKASGQYPGPSESCAKVTAGNYGCVENHDTATNGGVDCSSAALQNCSCDLNVFYDEPTTAAPSLLDGDAW